MCENFRDYVNLRWMFFTRRPGFNHALRDAMRLRRFHPRLRRDFFVVGVGALDDPFERLLLCGLDGRMCVSFSSSVTYGDTFPAGEGLNFCVHHLALKRRNILHKTLFIAPTKNNETIRKTNYKPAGACLPFFTLKYLTSLNFKKM